MEQLEVESLVVLQEVNVSLGSPYIATDNWCSSCMRVVVFGFQSDLPPPVSYSSEVDKMTCAFFKNCMDALLLTSPADMTPFLDPAPLGIQHGELRHDLPFSTSVACLAPHVPDLFL